MMTGTTISCQVLPQHIDRFGHLNNAFYAYYFELGRIALQEQNELSDRSLKCRHIGLWVRDSYIRRMHQVGAGDEIEIHSELLGYSGLMLYAWHVMAKGGREVSFAVTEHFFVKLGPNPTPMDLPNGIKNLPKLEGMQNVTLNLLGIVERIEERKRVERIRNLVAT